MYCGPRPSHVLPAIVHPTKCCVNNSFQNNIVPHIHPSHTTNVNHVHFQHVHSFPHTQSVVNEVTNQQFVAAPGPFPGGYGGGFGVPRPGMFGGGPFY
ncbi:CotD family spore coat protein [Cytobacillus dafuensis]|uniref:Spore coat protein CotH n=1 Tax=Cytobacillus dafuensis TaxID=1742359 RepID=A0A5B8Z664_CYTDA|nr:CotD family spore coat protein [Cytobacillus dafuensis]QED48387.1 spore coat protein CotH [Cytobacillus dafuensis]